eukprot:6189323-Pleurochrysis_carterae.AAC.6
MQINSNDLAANPAKPFRVRSILTKRDLSWYGACRVAPGAPPPLLPLPPLPPPLRRNSRHTRRRRGCAAVRHAYRGV